MAREGITPEKLAAFRRRKEIAALYLRGLTQWEIAEKVGVNQGTVSRHLKTLFQEWLNDAREDFDLKKARELGKINVLEEIALVAWERSCRDAETMHVK